jgi:hypothetical protein
MRKAQLQEVLENLAELIDGWNEEKDEDRGRSNNALGIILYEDGSGRIGTVWPDPEQSEQSKQRGCFRDFTINTQGEFNNVEEFGDFLCQWMEVEPMKTHTAQLNPTSPRYATWRDILGGDTVPVTTSQPFRARFGGIEEVHAFALDLPRLTPEQRTRLVDWITGQFKAGRAGVEAELDQAGFPIRAVDVCGASEK